MALLGYARVSTVHRDDELQRHALRNVAVDAEHIYLDVLSGTKEARTRPEMYKLLSFARPGDALVVRRIDWLGRSLLDALSTAHELRDRDIAGQSISDGIDSATRIGRLMLNMLSALAEYERDLIVERVDAGIAASRRAGVVFGWPVSDPNVIAEKLQLAGKPGNGVGRRRRVPTS